MTSSLRTFGFDEITGLSRDLLKQGFAVKLRAGGFSMFPYLRRKDVLQVKPVPASEVKPGDIIVFYRVNRFIAHRVHKTEFRSDTDFNFITYGDSALHRDETVNPENYLGKVIACERGKKSYPLTTAGREQFGRFVVKSYPLFNGFSWLLMRLNLGARRVVRIFLKLVGRR